VIYIAGAAGLAVGAIAAWFVSSIKLRRLRSDFRAMVEEAADRHMDETDTEAKGVLEHATEEFKEKIRHDDSTLSGYLSRKSGANPSAIDRD